jgi:hypothetical protein
MLHPLMHFGVRKTAQINQFVIFSTAVFHRALADRYGLKLEWAVIRPLIMVSYARGMDAINSLCRDGRFASAKS